MKVAFFFLSLPAIVFLQIGKNFYVYTLTYMGRGGDNANVCEHSMH